jgi:hypothetical protein
VIDEIDKGFRVSGLKGLKGLKGLIRLKGFRVSGLKGLMRLRVICYMIENG